MPLAVREVLSVSLAGKTSKSEPRFSLGAVISFMFPVPVIAKRTERFSLVRGLGVRMEEAILKLPTAPEKSDGLGVGSFETFMKDEINNIHLCQQSIGTLLSI